MSSVTARRMRSSTRNSAAFQKDRPSVDLASQSTSGFSAGGVRARVQYPRSTWFTGLKDRLDELTALPIGWDGYAGGPVTFTNAHFTASLLERLYNEDVPPPQLVPGGDGTVQFEWHRKNFDVEVDVLGPYNVVAVRRNLAIGKTDEIELQADFSILVQWISELA